MDENALKTYLQSIHEAFENRDIIKISISKKMDKSDEIKTVTAKLVEIKNELMLSFTLRYPTQDLTKNFDLSQSKKKINTLLENTFLQSELYTSEKIYHFVKNKKGNARLLVKNNHQTSQINLAHDRKKKRLLNPASAYFNLLGISSKDGQVRKDGQAKFRQINKFIETIDSLGISHSQKRTFKIYDMGSGKGYLSFALYDYLNNIKKIPVQLTGIELRQDLVDKCNGIADQCGFSGLNFEKGFIENASIDKTDMLIALHACDTATDDAIAKGIKSAAQYIICSPCCHKQIRPQVSPDNSLNLLTQHGILKERFSEMLTDTIRGLLLESRGYKTKIMEYVSTEHTPKNLLIMAIKKQSSDSTTDKASLGQIASLKKMAGIKKHYLETLLDQQSSA